MTNAQSDTLIANPHDAAKPLTAPNLHHVVKLNPLNYTTWRFQLTNILFGLSLLGFIDGSNPAPAATIIDAANKETPNPAHMSWLKQDGLILGALMGTISAALQTLIVRAKTSKEAWDKLAHTYANPSRIHIQQIKTKFDSLSKTTDQTITEYIHSIKSCVDQLALMGKILDPEDVISRVLNGLDYDLYQPVIDQVRNRDTAIPFETLHEKLLQQELLLTHKQSATQNHYQPSANHAFKNQHNNRHHNRSYNNQTQPSVTYNHQSQPTASSHNPNTPRPFKGRCQWCRETGHVIAHCPIFRKLFPNITFPAPPPNRYLQPQAHAAALSSDSVPNPHYLLDSGASHHVTHDLDTLAFHSPYSGLDELLIGDGSGLTIANTGDGNGNHSSPGPS